ncbi:MAG: Y-family DNA polymerase [Burkholderiales bacterium]|nr:Y-family DNA polymerase [Burkholderiales bacterium]
MFALVDVNNMYVSCERVFRPALNGRPVVVLSNNDGACIARSNEAKDLGVRMAQPWFEVRHLERTAGLVALSANFELYGDMSSRMMSLAAEFAPRQEIYSIDECFLDFEGVPGERSAIGRELRRKVLQWTGLPTSVGFGATKTLAKLANHVAKTAERKPGHYPPELRALAQRLAQVCDFGRLTAGELEAVMQATEVGDVWGIGRKTSARLNEGGIRTVLDLVRADVATLRRQFSVVVEKTIRELRGTPCMDVNDAPEANQQIMCSRSFGAPVTELSDLIEVMSQFASQVARRLREQGSVAGAVHVFISTSPYRRNDRQHAPSATLPLPQPSADTRVLISAAVRALRSIYRPGFNYAKAGAMLVDLHAQAPGPEPGQGSQATLDLFEPDPQPQAPLRGRAGERTDLMSALDTLNERFGRGAVAVASATRRAGPSAHVSRQERRSPRYTTRLEEIAKARAA